MAMQRLEELLQSRNENTAIAAVRTVGDIWQGLVQRQEQQQIIESLEQQVVQLHAMATNQLPPSQVQVVDVTDHATEQPIAHDSAHDAQDREAESQ